VTDRLYYQDSFLLEFDAAIVDSRQADGKWHTVLNRSAFYPTSGGQLHDTGTLNGVEVIEVIETDSGDVCHVTGREVGAVGDNIRGTVNAARRLGNRQKHTAQHILSQAFIKLAQAETVSVHLGEEYASVELSAGELSDKQLAEVETLSNQIIVDNIPVEVMFVSSDQAASMPLRKVPDRTGKIRVIRIGNLDWSACGGTHCRQTAEVSVIKLIGTEKIRGHLSVRFLAGRQALDDYRRRFDLTQALSHQLTCHINDIVGKFDKLSAENKDQRKQLAELQAKLLPMRAQELAQQIKQCGKTKLVFHVEEAGDVQMAAKLAREVIAHTEGVAVLLVGDRMVIAAHEAGGVKAGVLAKELAAKTSLKGGGSDNQAQLGGANIKQADEYRRIIEELLGYE